MNVLQYLIEVCGHVGGISMADLCRPFMSELCDTALALIAGAGLTLAILTANAALNCFDIHKPDAGNNTNGIS